MQQRRESACAEKAAINFAEYDGSGKSLRDIYLECCRRYSCKRNSALSNLLSTTPGDYDKLREIDLATNVVGSRGVLALLHVVAVCTGLVRLSLRGNSLDHRCVCYIAEVAKSHKSLQCLDLSYNRIGTSGKAIYELIRSNRRMVEVALDNTYIDAYMLKRINERLLANRMVQQHGELSPPPSSRQPPPPPPQQQQPQQQAPLPPRQDPTPAQAAAPAPQPAAVQPEPPEQPPPTTRLPSPGLHSTAPGVAADSAAPPLPPPSLRWWEGATPILSGSGYQPAPALEPSAAGDEDWAAFPLRALFDPAQYPRFLPVATKLVALAPDAGLPRPPDPSEVPRPSDRLPGRIASAFDEITQHSSTSEAMSVVDYSDATSLDESCDAELSEGGTVVTSELSEDELREAQQTEPTAEGPKAPPDADAAAPDGVSAGANDEGSGGSEGGGEEVPTFAGVNAPAAPGDEPPQPGPDEVVNLPAVLVERSLAAACSCWGDSTSPSGAPARRSAASYLTLHERRLATLNLIYGTATHIVLRAPLRPTYVHRLPLQAAETPKCMQRPSTRPGAGLETQQGGIRAERERMDLLFSMIDLAAPAPAAAGQQQLPAAALTRALAATALSSLGAGFPGKAETAAPSAAGALHSFLLTCAEGLLRDARGPNTGLLGEVVAGMVRVALSQGRLSDILSACQVALRLPSGVRVPGVAALLRAVPPSIQGPCAGDPQLAAPFAPCRQAHSGDVWARVGDWPATVGAERCASGPPLGAAACSGGVVVATADAVLRLSRVLPLARGDPTLVVADTWRAPSITLCGPLCVARGAAYALAHEAPAPGGALCSPVCHRAQRPLRLFACPLQQDGAAAWKEHQLAGSGMGALWGMLPADGAHRVAFVGEASTTRRPAAYRWDPDSGEWAEFHAEPPAAPQHHRRLRFKRARGCVLSLGTKSGRYSFLTTGPEGPRRDGAGGEAWYGVGSVLIDAAQQAAALAPAQFTVELWATVDLSEHPTAVEGEGDDEGDCARLLGFSSYAQEVSIAVGPLRRGVAELRAGYVCGRGSAACAAVPAAVLGSWFHVALSYRQSQWHLALNGESAAVSPPCLHPPRLADRGWTVGQGLSGSVGELRVWGAARTLAEVQRDMHAALTGTEEGLAAYLPLNEGRGRVVTEAALQSCATPAVVSEVWEADEGVAGIVWGDLGPEGDVWEDAPDCPVPPAPCEPAVLLPPPELLAAHPPKVYGSPDRGAIRVAFPAPTFPFVELARAAAASSQDSPAAEWAAVMDVRTGAFHVDAWCPANHAGAVGDDAAFALCGAPDAEAGCGPPEPDCVAIIRSRRQLPRFGGAEAALVPAAAPCAAMLDPWPPPQLAGWALSGPGGAQRLQQLVREFAAAAEHAAGHPHEDSGGSAVAVRLAALLARAADACKGREGLCFQIPFVTEVGPAVFRLAAELAGAPGAPPLVVCVCLRLAALHLRLAAQANVSPSALGLSGGAGPADALLLKAESILDQTAAAAAEDAGAACLRVAAVAFLRAAIPLNFPRVQDRVRCAAAGLQKAAGGQAARGAAGGCLLACLTHLASAPHALAAAVRESHLRAVADEADPSRGAARAGSILGLAAGLLQALRPDEGGCHPSLRPAAEGALLQLQRSLVALAVALHRAVRPRFVASGLSSAASVAAGSKASCAASTAASSPATSPAPQPSRRSMASGGTAAPTAAEEGLCFMRCHFFPYMEALRESSLRDACTVGAASGPPPVVLCSAFPVFVASLPLLDAYAEELLKGLSSLLPLFCKMVREQGTQGGAKAEATDIMLRQQKVVQAGVHAGDVPQVYRICVPGARCLSLRFDPEWTLDGESLVAALPGRDPDGEGEPLAREEGWPEEPVVFAGTDTVLLYFDPQGSSPSEGARPRRGFRCTVTGDVPVQYPRLPWLHDVALDLLHTAARLCTVLTSSYAFPCTPVDDALSHWIAELGLEPPAAAAGPSPSRQGPEGVHPFWASMIENEGAGAKLYAQLLRRGPATAQPHLGGEQVNKSLRAAFAAVMCHLGVSAAVMEEAATGEDLPRVAVRIWRRTEELRHWLLELRQRARNRADEPQEAEAGRRPSAVGEDPVEAVLGRALVLLRCPPSRDLLANLRTGAQQLDKGLASAGSLADLLRSDSAVMQPALGATRRSSVTLGATGKRAQGQQGENSAVARLRRIMRKSRNARACPTPERREAALFQFCQDDRVTLDHFNDFVSKRLLLARRRLVALECFERLVVAGPEGEGEGEAGGLVPPALRSARPGLVQVFLRAIRGHHYLDNLAPSGRDIEAAIQAKVYSIVTSLARQLGSAAADGGEWADEEERAELFLQLMSCAWRGADYAFVLRLDVLSTFGRLCQHCSPQLRAKAWQVLQLFALRAALETAPPGGASGDNPNSFAFGDAGLQMVVSDETIGNPKGPRIESPAAPAAELAAAPATVHGAGPVADDGDGDSEGDRELSCVAFLRRVLALAADELRQTRDAVLALKERHRRARGRLAAARARVDEAAHKLRIECIRRHLKRSGSHGQHPRGGHSQRRDPDRDKAITSPVSQPLSTATAASLATPRAQARATVRGLRDPLKSCRQKARQLADAISVRTAHLTGWLALVTTLANASPAVVLDILSETGLLSLVFSLLSPSPAGLGLDSDAAVGRHCFTLLRCALPHVSPAAADAALPAASHAASQPAGVGTLVFLTDIAASISPPALHRRSRVVTAYLNHSPGRAITRILRILLHCKAWGAVVADTLRQALADERPWWVRKQPDGEPLVPLPPHVSPADQEAGSRVEPRKRRRMSAGASRSSSRPDTAQGSRPAEEAPAPAPAPEEAGVGDEVPESEGSPSGASERQGNSAAAGNHGSRGRGGRQRPPRRQQQQRRSSTADAAKQEPPAGGAKDEQSVSDEVGASAGGSESQGGSDREARRKARKNHRRKSRMQRYRMLAAAEAGDDSKRDTDGLTEQDRRVLRLVGLALAVLGGGEIRLEEGQAAVCRLRRGARQHVIVQRTAGQTATVVPLTARGAFITARCAHPTQPLVDIARNPPREVHSDRLVIATAEALTTPTATPERAAVLEALCKLLSRMLHPIALAEVISHHPPGGANLEPQLWYPTFKLSQIKRRFSCSWILPSHLRALLAALAEPGSATDCDGVLRSGKVLPPLLRLCSLRIEQDDPVPFQNLGEMCAVVNFVLPHRSSRPSGTGEDSEEEADDFSDRDQYADEEEEEEGEGEEEDEEVEEEEGDEEGVEEAEPDEAEEGGESLFPVLRSADTDFEAEHQGYLRTLELVVSEDLPEVATEYHFETFAEGSDEAATDEDGWEFLSDANESEDDGGYVSFRRVEMLRRMCQEDCVRREAWRLDLTLSSALGARVVLTLLRRCVPAADQDPQEIDRAALGPPVLVLKFLMKCFGMVHRGYLEEELLSHGLWALLRAYADRTRLAELALQQGFHMLSTTYSGPQSNPFGVGLVLLESIAADDRLASCALQPGVLGQCIVHAHSSTGWRRRVLLLFLARLLPVFVRQPGVTSADAAAVMGRLQHLGRLLEARLNDELREKAGTAEHASMFAQALTALMASAHLHIRPLLPDGMEESARKSSCQTAVSFIPGQRSSSLTHPLGPLQKADPAPGSERAFHDEEAEARALTEAALRMLRVFSEATEALTSGTAPPRALLLDESPEDAVPAHWQRYGWPDVDMFPLCAGLHLRGLWDGGGREAGAAGPEGELSDPSGAARQVSVETYVTPGTTVESATANTNNSIVLRYLRHSQPPGQPPPEASPAEVLLANSASKVRAEAFHNFATVAGSVRLSNGCWYFEVEVETCTFMQVGWAAEGFRCDSEEGKGVGDDAHSWAYDGPRSCRWHDGKQEPYGAQQQDAGGHRSDRDADRQQRRKAQRRRRRRAKARRRRRMQGKSGVHASGGSLDMAAASDGGRDGASQHPEDGDESAEGEWQVDDGEFMSADEVVSCDGHHADQEDWVEEPGWRAGDVIGCVCIVEDGVARLSFSLNGVDLGVAYDGISVGSGLSPAVSLQHGDAAIFNLGGAAFRYRPQGCRGCAEPLTWLPRLLADQCPPQPTAESRADLPRDPRVWERIGELYSDQWHKLVGHTSAAAAPQTPDDFRRRAQAVGVDESALLAAVGEGGAATARAVLRMLGRFNALARLCVPLISLEEARPGAFGLQVAPPCGRDFSLLATLCRARALLFPAVKEPIVDRLMAGATREGRVCSVLLARDFASRREGGSGLRESLFDQLHSLCRAKRPSMFRTHELCDASARLWTVVFEGEAAEDAGGPFRESLSTICEELCPGAQLAAPQPQEAASAPAPGAQAGAGADGGVHRGGGALFLLSPNHRGNFGDVRDRWLPRPSLRGAAHSPQGALEHELLLNKYRFLGRLVAGCMSIGEPMDVSLCSIVWKALAGSPADRGDLATVDQMCLQALDAIVHIEDTGVTPDQFSLAIDERFVTTLSDGQEHELVPGGADKEVTFANREEYAALVIKARLEESGDYLAALRSGFTDVLPHQVLGLLTWKELERRVCGTSELSVDDLRRCCVYEDIDEKGPIVARFWEAVSSFTSKDLTLLLRFIAARSRLPVPIKIQPYCVDGDPDQYLPQAHTCFFSIELPEYSSAEVMRSKLHFAIHNCRAIDTDGAPVGLDDMDADDDDDFEYEEEEEF